MILGEAFFLPSVTHTKLIIKSLQVWWYLVILYFILLWGKTTPVQVSVGRIHEAKRVMSEWKVYCRSYICAKVNSANGFPLYNIRYPHSSYFSSSPFFAFIFIVLPLMFSALSLFAPFFLKRVWSSCFYGKSFYFCTRLEETKCFLEMLIKRL